MRQLLDWASSLHRKNLERVWIVLESDDLDDFLTNVAPCGEAHGTNNGKDAVFRFQANIKLDVKL